MKRSLPLLLAAVFMLLVAPRVSGLDAQKLDRTIGKEPAYASKNPRYCLLVFGPEAKFRVWLVVDGDFLYVDGNGNGDLTEPGERRRFGEFGEAGEMGGTREAAAATITEGKLKHENLRIRQQRLKADFTPRECWQEQLKALARREPDVVIYEVSLSLEIRPRPGDPIRIAGRISQYAGMDGNGFLQFGKSPREAPVIHFRGPMRMGLYAPQRLILASTPADLQTVVGTSGLGNGTFASVGYFGLIGDEAKPVAEVEFPADSPGNPRLQTRQVLAHRC